MCDPETEEDDDPIPAAETDEGPMVMLAYLMTLVVVGTVFGAIVWFLAS